MRRKTDRIGTTKKLYGFLTATCSGYKNDNDIDITFSNSFEMHHATWEAFMNNLYFIEEVELKGGESVTATGRIHFTLTDKNKTAVVRYGGNAMIEMGKPVFQRKLGMNAACVGYINYRDVDLRLENGAVAYHQWLSYFKDGYISAKYSRDRGTSRIGEVYRLPDSRDAMITMYRSDYDIDIVTSDGNAAHHITLDDIANGNAVLAVTKTGTAQKEGSHGLAVGKLGVWKEMKCGLLASCTEYINYDDASFLFNNGEKAEHKKWRMFSKGLLIPDSEPDLRQVLARNKYMGCEYTQSCGMKAKVIAYRRATDIDVQFTDGTIVRNVRISTLRDGLIRNPNLTIFERKLGRSKRSVRYAIDKDPEKTFIQRNGMKVKVIAYRGCFDIDVEFDDGIIVRHATTQALRSGKIDHPDSPSRRKYNKKAYI